VQLRQDNALGTLFNIVGFQTKIRHAAQVDVLRMIPGLENAQFARLGGIHRNTFLNSPKLLDYRLRLKARPSLRFAGQVTGVEGYVESAAIGMLAGLFAAAELQGRTVEPPPPTTAFGALLAHVTGGHLLGEKGSFQPMNVNFGLFPPINPPARVPGGPRLRGAAKAEARKRAWTARARADLAAWMASGHADASTPVTA
jgi:methylenetetrahydrofolate--tRNA-(uracil-5-)-methyltransferase